MKQFTAPTVRPRFRAVTVILLILTIAAGIASRQFPSYLPPILHKNAGDILWATAVYFLFVTLSPSSFPGRVFFLTTLLGVGVEGFKLYHAPWIEAFRASTLGGLLLGHAFSWSNIGCYALGAFLALILDAIVAWWPGKGGK